MKYKINNLSMNVKRKLKFITYGNKLGRESYKSPYASYIGCIHNDNDDIF